MSANSRKRGAPGTAPIVPIPQPMPQQYATGNAAADQLTRWQSGDANGYVDRSGQAANPYGFMPAQSQPAQGIPSASNSIARRENSHALVPTNSMPNFDSSVEPWTGFGDDGSLIPQNQGEQLTETDNVDILEEMAQKAKRDAQGKRKPIPPFVQKLSSFLEEGKNEDLIRWSQNGDSFIVLDEDEFAKTLIPELFKHNNYASFVRQLNMYGFHKRVGLSDNSMRASERKNKSPSEYSNPYFRRGHPNLLWLIKKPKGKSKKAGGKHADGDADSEEDILQDEAPVQGQSLPNIAAGRPLPPPEGGPIQKKEMAVIREELRQMREQQKVILSSITRLQRNNNDLYSQAMMFQNQHDRHQNSINAILNFLANVFRKTLEDQGNTQNVNDIISSMISNQNQQGTQPGSVVDLGDFFTQANTASALGGPPKRARGLLPPIPNYNGVGQSSTSPASVNSSYHPVGSQNPEMGHVTELLDVSPADTPPNLRQELESNPHERMMKIINDHNATNQSGMDLPEAAELVANAPNTLSNDQRSQLVDFMAGQTSSPSNTAGTSATASGSRRSGSNATPVTDPNIASSLSPIMRSPPMQPPSLHHINDNQADLSRLQRLQSEQAAKISELSEMLGPLSPNGHIPGLGEADPYGDAPNVDLDQYFDSDAYLNDGAFGGDMGEFNFNLDADGNPLGFNPSGLDVTGNNNNTPSPTGTEEIPRTDLGGQGTSDGRNKRRRVD